MRYFIIILSVVFIGFIILSSRYCRKKENTKKTEKPSFRSDKDLEEYGKPMEDGEQNVVDFDDAE